MKSIFFKLNEIFSKTDSLYLRFLISLVIILIPFLSISILVLIAVKNYLRAMVLILFLIVSCFDRTKDNKIVLGFIGIIPFGFYVVTSPLIAGWYLGTVVKDIGGIIFSNPITTIISGVSIYGVIKVLKGTTSIYEWFVNTGIGGYFFPGYKNLKDQISLQNRTITQLLNEQNALVIALRSARATLQQLKLDTQGMFSRLTDSQNTVTCNLPPQSTNNAIILAQNDGSISTTRIQQQITQTIDNTINNIDIHITQNQENTRQIIEVQKQSQAIIPVSISDSTLIAVQKVLLGGGVLVGAEVLSRLIGTDNSYLLHGYDLLKQTLDPKMMPIVAYITGDVTTRTVGGVKNIAATASGVFQETKNLVKKGVKNITESMKFIPNIRQSSDFVKIDILKTTTPEELKLQLLEGLKEAEKKQAIPNTNIDPTKGQFRDVKTVKNLDATPGKIQDVSLVRKSGYQDFIDPNDYKPNTSPKPQTKQHGFILITEDKPKFAGYGERPDDVKPATMTKKKAKNSIDFPFTN